MEIKESALYFGSLPTIGLDQWEIAQGPDLSAAYNSLTVAHQPLAMPQNTQTINPNIQSPASQDLFNGFANENRELAKVCGAATGIIDFNFGAREYQSFAFKNIYHDTSSNLATQNEKIVVTDIGAQAVASGSSSGQSTSVVHLNQSGEGEFIQFQTMDQSTDPYAYTPPSLLLGINILSDTVLTISNEIAFEISEMDTHIETLDTPTYDKLYDKLIETFFKDVNLESLPVGLLQTLKALGMADAAQKIITMIKADMGSHGENYLYAFAGHKSGTPSELFSEGEQILLTSIGSQAIIGHTEDGEIIFITALETQGELYFLLYHPIDHSNGLESHGFFSLLFPIQVTEDHGNIVLANIELKIFDSNTDYTSEHVDNHEVVSGYLLDQNGSNPDASITSIEDPEGNTYSYDGTDTLMNGETFLEDTSLLTLTVENSELEGELNFEFAGAEAGEFEYTFSEGSTGEVVFTYTTMYADGHTSSHELELYAEGDESYDDDSYYDSTANIATSGEYIHAEDESLMLEGILDLDQDTSLETLLGLSGSGSATNQGEPEGGLNVYVHVEEVLDTAPLVVV